MNFEPNKFFIGLMDFFSILLPGALLSFIIKNKVYQSIVDTSEPFDLSNSESWVIFLFASYLLGHFIFLLGAKFLDDLLYEKISNARSSKQAERLYKGDKLQSKLMRWLGNHFFKVYADRSLRKVLRIKSHYLQPLVASESINAFQWSKTRLNLHHPRAAMEVQQFEANSKFFRSLMVVFCLLFVWFLVFNNWIFSVASLILIIPASWRYIDQRMKSVRLTYWYIITLEAADPNGFREKPISGEHEITHAGGIVHKGKGLKREFLLVQTKKPPRAWVFPKGHIEPGESAKETAIREVKEETGIWASIESKIGTSSFELNGKIVNVQFFLMKSMEEGKAIEKRAHKWFELDDAVSALEHEDNKSLLMKFKNDS